MKILSVEDGLSQSSVQWIDQDIFGMTWISTGDGLNSFDGKEFRNYYPPISLSSSNKMNRLRRVVSDATGNLWVGSDEGLLFFNRITNRLEVPFPEIRMLAKGYCYPLFCDGDSVHTLLGDSTVLSIHIKNKKTRTRNLGVLIYRVIYNPENNGELWGMSVPSTLWNFGFVSGKLRIRTYELHDVELLNDICRIRDHEYVFASFDQIGLFNSQTGEIVSPVRTGIPKGPGNSTIRCLRHLESGEMWIGTLGQGIHVLDEQLNYQYTLCGPDEKRESLAPLPNLSLIYEDPGKNIWIGTDGSGVALINPGRFGFRKMNTLSSDNKRQNPDFVRCFYEDEDRVLWIGTFNNGLKKWNRKTNQVDCYYPSSNPLYSSSNDIISISPAGKSKLILGTPNGIVEFDKKSGRFFPLEKRFASNLGFRSYCLTPLSDDYVLFLIYNKLFGIKKTGYTWALDTISFPDSVKLNYLSRVQSGNVIGFSSSGIYDLSTDRYKFSGFKLKDRPVMLKINSISEAGEGTIYAATDKGLVMMRSSGEILRIYDTDDGLPNPFLNGILRDDHNNLWISSNKGLSHFDIKKEKFFNFSMADGLQSPEFNSGAAYRCNDGTMFFGGIRGINYFYPDSVFSSLSSPQVLLTDIKVNDGLFVPDSSFMSKHILILPYSRNTVTFEFNTIEYIYPGYTSYKYRLEGFDRQWIFSGSVNQARYAKLPPGKYTFTVMASNRQGNWSRMPASITLLIVRPFWMKAWFRILAAIVIIAILSAVVYYVSTLRIRKRLAYLERLNEINLVRRRISSDLHDEIGTGLSKLAMMSDTASGQTSENNPVHAKLKNLSSAARQLIDRLRVIVWTLNPQYDQLESLIGYIHQQAGDFLDHSPVNARFLLPEFIPQLTVSPDIKRNMHYVVMESVHNVVKHSGSSDVLITIGIKDHMLVIEIADHGKGFDRNANKSFGNGLTIMRKRMEEIGGQFQMESIPGKGTKVIIRVRV